ncbi:MAG: alpha/beta fold hydrolase, partial [Ilumatobacteraceae bacterium]
LTNCDAFEMFPPPALRRFITLLSHPSALATAAQAMRSTAVRHGKLGFGPFANCYDAEMTAAWIEPLRDAAVRRDLSRFARAVDTDDLVAVGSRLDRFAGPARLVWGTDDPFFTLDLARRLAAAFGEAEVVEVPGARTFVPLDTPDRLAAEILVLSSGNDSQRSVAEDRTAHSGG